MNNIMISMHSFEYYYYTLIFTVTFLTFTTSFNAQNIIEWTGIIIITTHAEATVYICKKKITILFAFHLIEEV